VPADHQSAEEVTMNTTDRTGIICMHDASLSVMEEGIPNINSGFKARDAWEDKFKADVFDRIVATLAESGWKVGTWDRAKLYPAIAANHYTCHHPSGLDAELSVSGRCVELNMWQDVTPSENPNGGQYDFDKLKRMPYLLRLQVERTRQRVTKALCGAFPSYSVKPAAPVLGMMGSTAEEMARHRRVNSGHYKPELDRAEISMASNAIARDGGTIEHGGRVWALDHKGRVVTGTAYYSLGSQWQIVTGRYGLLYCSMSEIFTQPPDNLRVKRNQRERRMRLEREMQAAIKSMNFKRAEVLKGILFPEGPLYAIWSKKHGNYFDVMYCGYQERLSDAGKYTRDELKPYLGNALETDEYRAVPIEA
jgi:hypothetical protein